MLLTRYENEGILHVALISRGNEALVTELLQRQTDILNELYLVPEESLFETNAEDYMESEESPSEEETALPEESQETTSEADERRNNYMAKSLLSGETQAVEIHVLLHLGQSSYRRQTKGNHYQCRSCHSHASRLDA